MLEGVSCQAEERGPALHGLVQWGHMSKVRSVAVGW